MFSTPWASLGCRWPWQTWARRGALGATVCPPAATLAHRCPQPVCTQSWRPLSAAGLSPSQDRLGRHRMSLSGRPETVGKRLLGKGGPRGRHAPLPRAGWGAGPQARKDTSHTCWASLGCIREASLEPQQWERERQAGWSGRFPAVCSPPPQSPWREVPCCRRNLPAP